MGDITSESVSRVLSFKAIICLGCGLPHSSRHLSELWPSRPLLSVLLRIGFAGPCSLLHAGELLPRLSTLTGINAGGISLLHCPGGHPRRPLAVILLCEARTFLVQVRNCPTHLLFYFITDRLKSQSDI